jgi:hypothetical protein
MDAEYELILVNARFENLHGGYVYLKKTEGIKMTYARS